MPPPIEEEWPAILLVRPQMGENIGAVARVLLNFGLISLRLVAPRDRWPNPKAEVVAVGADKVLKGARVEWSLDEALADATLVIAASARPRGLEKPVWGPREAALNIRAALALGEKPVVMFGPEAAGMETEEIARADAIMTLPVNPGFASLNLANAVAVFAFAYAEARQVEDLPSWFRDSESEPATQEELEKLFGHLEQELEHGRFFHPDDKAALMKRNLRSIFLRARLTVQEAQTLRGVIKALTIGRGGRKKDDL
ncbi:tRNA (cytidine/uridine-2'-O-)-methyltransferase TrmJ [Terricaulis silvestris]|uniref:tRNA (Cytidine/uridine-2'-O-)-methyltransferase TrmJ n=2 Tax=Terricaulis silvestris TaxID=2686094 RepID=A0A6I6MLT6_9CAUL|nr:tRNA (cytidine/uridine-2'-O-)-methyltransferase TrmJ [Terricaulis silvestris]